MDKIEAEIKRNEEEIRNSLNRLAHMVPRDKQASFQKAKTAYGELAKITAQVIDLSRQNTNIKSFELSLAGSEN